MVLCDLQICVTPGIYNICKTKAQGHACCIGQPITFDPRIVFRDGRRRNSQRNTGNDIVLNLWGTCASTGQEVRKCSRCIEKDKVLTQRKRKRDTNLVWNESDDESNSRLIQVLTSGNEVVDSSGEVKFRIRIGCCVGVNKQHHLNHLSMDNNIEMHKGCPGLTLSLSVSEKNSTIATVASQPLRILGKVTTADRKKFGPQSEESSGSGLSTSSGSSPLTSSPALSLSQTQSVTPQPLIQQTQTQTMQPLQVAHNQPHQPQPQQHLQPSHLQPQQVQQQLHQPQRPQPLYGHQIQSKMPGTGSFSAPLLEPLPSDFMSDALQPIMMNSLPDPHNYQYSDSIQSLAVNPIVSGSLLCQSVNYYLQIDPYEKLFDLAIAFRYEKNISLVN